MKDILLMHGTITIILIALNAFVLMYSSRNWKWLNAIPLGICFILIYILDTRGALWQSDIPVWFQSTNPSLWWWHLDRISAGLDIVMASLLFTTLVLPTLYWLIGGATKHLSERPYFGLTATTNGRDASILALASHKMAFATLDMLIRIGLLFTTTNILIQII